MVTFTYSAAQLFVPPPTMKKKLSDEQIEQICKMKECNSEWDIIAKVVGSNKETVRKAYKRFKDLACLPPKEKKDKSKFSGRLAAVLKRIVKDNPSYSNEDLSNALKSHCREGEKPPSRECVRRFLGRNGYKYCKLPKKHIIYLIR